MSKKNWKAIAAVGDQQLRLVLISATGEIAEGLEKGFPQYFGGEFQTVSCEEIVRVASEARRVDEILQICRDQGIPHQRFSFSGSCRGEVDGLPNSQGGYSTVRHGWGNYFLRSTKQQGDVLNYEGAEWLVLWNSYLRGSAESFAHHTVVIVPVASLA